jgi:hydrogenase maturation protease
MNPGTLVIGLGNLVHSDDGVGVHAVHRLQTDPRVAPEVSLIDGGTQGLSLIPHISGFPRLLVIDAVDVGEAPGTVIRMDGAALDGLRGKPTVHQLGFADLMIALKLLGDAPEEVIVFGVQPLSTEWSATLTPAVQASLDRLTNLVVAQLEAWSESPRATLVHPGR